MKKVYEGLAILLKYDPDGDIAAHHDQILTGGPSPSEASKEDLDALEKLGWRFDLHENCWCIYV